MPTLLIVDDRDTVLQTFEYLFGLRGYRVLLANSGSQAVALAKAERIDGALIDVHMPVMDGFQTLAALAGLVDASSPVPPIWLMSAVHTTAMAERAAAVGAKALLTKPFDSDQFAEAFEKAITSIDAVPLVPLPAPFSSIERAS